jgi:predicted dehydrogenase
MVGHLAREEPRETVAHGESYVHVRPGVEDAVFCFMRFPSGPCARLHLSWLDPHNERRFTVVGSRQMATFDDMAREGELTIYDKGFEEAARGYGEYITRGGAIYSRQIPKAEPLRVECERFVHRVRTGETPRSDGASGLRVVRVLEQLRRSLEGSSVVAAGAQAGA